jgi:uncharacterized protein YebE (UPF0316 family)
MDWKLLIVFVILNAVNVIIQTVRSLATIKCKKFAAACVNALAYGLYTVVVVYTVCDLPLWWKVVIVAVCNFIGVFFVKLFEEKFRKDKLWKVEATVPKVADIIQSAKLLNIPLNYIDIEKFYLVNFYCATQQDSEIVKQWLKAHDAKYFVSESKIL